MYFVRIEDQWVTIYQRGLLAPNISFQPMPISAAYEYAWPNAAIQKVICLPDNFISNQSSITRSIGFSWF